jgi:hypothetical protein
MFGTMITKRAMRLSGAVLLFVFVTIGTGALVVDNPAYGYSVDLPIGWVESRNSQPHHAGFLAPNIGAMMQIITLDAELGSTGAEVARYIADQVNARIGEPDRFSYQARSAAISEVAFLTGGVPVKGYVVGINDYRANYAILAFASVDTYDRAQDSLLSAIDSFSIGAESRYYPGPISQFLYPWPIPEALSTPIPFVSHTLPFSVGPGEVRATELVIDREARILAPYGAQRHDVFSAAWRRYFRMIYRDNYIRLGPLAQEIGALFSAARVPRIDYPHELLAWMQTFEYTSPGGISNLQAPLSTLTTGTGDCDSLALAYTIILHHLGIDAIVMLSDSYRHALAAVDVPSPGARFAFDDRKWLVAEFTADVPLGQIASNMADPKKWIGVQLRVTE